MAHVHAESAVATSAAAGRPPRIRFVVEAPGARTVVVTPAGMAPWAWRDLAAAARAGGPARERLVGDEIMFISVGEGGVRLDTAGGRCQVSFSAAAAAAAFDEAAAVTEEQARAQ